MALSGCWQQAPLGALGSLEHLSFGVQIYPQQLRQRASQRLQRWQRGQCPNVTRQPRCHLPADKESPVLITQWGLQCPPPEHPQEPEPGPWWDSPVTGFLEGTQLPHRSHKHCTNIRAGALPRLAAVGPQRLSAMQARFPWKGGGGPAKPIPGPLGILSSSPLLCHRHDLAESSPRHTRAALPGTRSSGVPQSKACSASSASAPYLQAQKSGGKLGSPTAFEPSSASVSTGVS